LLSPPNQALLHSWALAASPLYSGVATPAVNFQSFIASKARHLTRWY